MKRFIEGADRTQAMLLPECVEDYVGPDNPVRVVEAFVEQLDLRAMGFEGSDPQATGRPAYHPSVLLKIYIYGYLNRIQLSRRLEQETQRNIELMWLTARLMPDFKTIPNSARITAGRSGRSAASSSCCAGSSSCSARRWSPLTEPSSRRSTIATRISPARR